MTDARSVLPANADTAVSWREILSGTHAPSLALICMGVWLHAADSLLVATMLPALVAEIGGEALVGWTVALYEVGSIMTGAASGFLALRYGIRVPMGCAAALFAAGCAISALAPSMWIVLAGRLLQGIGGGGLAAMAFVAAGVLFPRRLIPRAMAVVSTLWGLSAFLGPLIGGLFVEIATWRAGFWFFAAQALAMALWIGLFATVREKPVQADLTGRLAVRRLSLLAAGVVCIAYGGVEIAPLRTALFIVVGLACLAAFLKLDSRAGEDRLLPPGALSFGTAHGAALVMILGFGMATIAITAYGPILVVMLHGASALVAGYIVACSSIGWSVAAVSVSGVPERHDMKFIAAGMAVITFSIIGFLYSVPNGPVWLIAVFAGLEGAGFGMAWVFVVRQATALAPPGEIERVSAAIPTVQRLGYALGAACIGIVANTYGFGEGMDPGDAGRAAGAIFLACLPFAAIGLAATARFVWLGQRHTRAHEQTPKRQSRKSCQKTPKIR